MGNGLAGRVPHYAYAYYLWARSWIWGGSRKKDGGEAVRDGLPVPPPHLRYRVHGAADAAGFLCVGRRCAHDVREILKSNGCEADGFNRVLDFGCGCGRVARFLYPPDASPETSLYGTDVDPQAIRWCRRNLPFGRWAVNGEHPPTRYEDGSFDLVYAISVFTHLSEALQGEWLDELRRVLKPGGLLLATFHGEAFAAKLNPDEASRLDKAGSLFTRTRGSGVKLDGLPNYYQTTFHRREYIEKTWGKSLSIIEYRPKGMNRMQDAVLLKKGAVSAPVPAEVIRRPAGG